MCEFYDLHTFTKQIKNNPEESIYNFYFQYNIHKVEFIENDYNIFGIDEDYFQEKDINLLWKYLHISKNLSIEYFKK